jgi:ATP-dependent DNA ligase
MTSDRSETELRDAVVVPFILISLMLGHLGDSHMTRTYPLSNRLRMPRSSAVSRTRRSSLPSFVRPHLSQLFQAAPDGPDWLHEIKYDGYRMHARLDAGDVRLLTRTGLDWTHKYLAIAAALSKLPVEQAYLDGELSGVREDGTTSFAIIQAASDARNANNLIFFLFDLLFLDDADLTGLPLTKRKARLATLLNRVGPPLEYSDHQIGRGPHSMPRRANSGSKGSSRSERMRRHCHVKPS